MQGLFTGMDISKEAEARDAVVPTTDNPRRTKGKHRKTSPVLTMAVWVRDIALTVAVIFGLFIVHMTYVTDLQNSNVQRELNSQLTESWSKPAEAHTRAIPISFDTDVSQSFGDGQPMFELRIPSIGVENTVVHGVSQWDLSRGAGFYPDSARPGERGNVSIAGHRIGKGAPFHHLDRLHVCDDIVIQTENRVYTYKVLDIDGKNIPSCIPPAIERTLQDYNGIKGRSIVQPTDIGVVEPVPYVGDKAPSTKAVAPLVTLTTCNPEYGNSERMIIHGVLVKEEERV